MNAIFFLISNQINCRPGKLANENPLGYARLLNKMTEHFTLEKQQGGAEDEPGYTANIDRDTPQPRSEADTVSSTQGTSADRDAETPPETKEIERRPDIECMVQTRHAASELGVAMVSDPTVATCEQEVVDEGDAEMFSDPDSSTC